MMSFFLNNTLPSNCLKSTEKKVVQQTSAKFEVRDWHISSNKKKYKNSKMAICLKKTCDFSMVI